MLIYIPSQNARCIAHERGNAMNVFCRHQIGFENQYPQAFFGVSGKFNVIHKNEHSFT
jgi:hypothetical protein